MVRYIDLPDGTLLKALSPLEDVPFHSDWLKALLERHAAFERREVDRRPGSETFGQHITVIVPYSSDHEQACTVQDDGSVLIHCIACAEQVPFREAVSSARRGYADKIKLAPTDKIRIGGIVQYAEYEPCNERHGSRVITAVRRWRRRMAAKMGFGCRRCLELYQAECNRVAEDNTNRAAYNECLKQMYMEKGDWTAAAKVKPVKEYTPFLDILGGEVLLKQLTAMQEARL